MIKTSAGKRDMDLNPVQRRILHQVYEILQLDEALWKPLEEFIRDYHQKVIEPIGKSIEPAATQQLTRLPRQAVPRPLPLQYDEPESLRSLIKRFIFAVSLFFENQQPYRDKDQPILAQEDLEGACSTCHGSGYVQHPEWKEWWETYSKTGAKNRPFPNVKEEMLCPQCGGKGTELTTQGKILVDGLKKHMK